MRKITLVLTLLLLGVVGAVSAQTISNSSEGNSSARLANRIAISSEMQSQIQEALNQRTITNPQTFNRAPLAATYVGSFNTSDGPNWTTNPAALSAVQAAALIFGGSPSDYAISTNPNTTDPSTITETAWVTTWGVGGCQEVAEDYFLDLGAPGYNDPGGANTAISAYVNDNCSGGANYVWLVRAINCPGDITVSNDPGICGAVVNYTVTANDPVLGAITPTQTAGLPSGSEFPIGVTTNTFEVTYSNGTTDSCSFDVTVNDTEAPVLTCPANITQSNDAGECGAVVTYPDPTATDNCGGNSNAGMGSFGQGGIGQGPSPDCNNGDSGSGGGGGWYGGGGGLVYSSGAGGSSYTIPSATSVIHAQGSNTGNGSLVLNFSVSPFTQVFGFTGGAQSFVVPAGVTTLSVDAYGAQGGSSGGLGGRVQADISVTPGEVLEIYVGGQGGNSAVGIVSGGFNGGGNSGMCGVSYCGSGGGGASDIRQGGTGLSDRVVVAGGGGGSHPINDPTNAGNGGGLIGGNVTSSGNGCIVTYATGGTQSSGGLEATANPACCSAPAPTITITQIAGLPSGSTFPVGTTTNTFETTDASGNTSTCSFDVTVNDTEAPVANCVAPFTVQLDALGNATINASDINGGSTDNCGIASFTFSETFTAFAEVAEGQNLTISLPGGAVVESVDFASYGTPNGSNGNYTLGGCHAANSQTIVESYALGNNSFTIPATNTVFGDPCGGTFKRLYVTVSYSSVETSETFTCSDIGDNTVTLTVTDANGNASTCTTVVTVEDSVAPVANCAAPFTIQLDANGNASITVADIENGSTDACGIASTTIDIDTFDCSNVGDNTVTLTVTDVNGNVSTCTTIVTVEDNVAPIANCAAPFTIQLDANGNASITVADIENGSTDACGIASTTIDIDTFDCSNVGDNTVTLTVTDVNGNVSTCTTIVTVEDNVAPIANCAAPFTIQLDANGNASITVADIDNGSSDACGIASTTIDVDTFDCSNVGPNNVVLTVTDNNGNISTCTTVVTVEDSIAPTIVCPANITANTDAGDCFATVSFSMPIAIDNCGIATVVQTMGDPSGSQFPVGVSTIEFTATDVNGNTNTCSFTITVTDNEAPVAVCQNITIQLDASGNATITAADVDGGSTDQCGVASISIDTNTFDCSNVGDNNVILTVTDVNGNTSTCTAIVTVEDVTAPVVACQNITVELDPITGTVTIDGTDIDNGSTDACGIASYDLDINTFDCSNIGDNTVVLTITDVNGNTETCTAIVTVEDNTGPVLVCQDFTIEIGADGTATLSPSDVIASNDDACGILTTAVDITQFSCADIGTPVTVQVFSQDNNGNLSTCTATVTVVDLLAPVLTCPADQTVDPGAGNLFYILPDYFATGEATAVDNCTDPVTITTQDPAVGTPLSDGTYTITLTATDEYGNTSTCEFELTVESILGVGNNNQSLGSISMYPNPAKGNVTIGNPQSLALESANIYDLTGRLVQTFSLRGMATAKTLNVDNLAAATYVVIIKGKEGQITKRLIKE